MRRLSIVLASGLVMAAVADSEPGNLLPNGDFEDVEIIAKASSHHVMGKLREGWQLSRGPIAFFPRGWFPSGGKGVFEAVDCSEDVRMKPYVRSGNVSMRLGDTVGGTCIYNRVWAPKPGRHRFTVWAKGTGTGNVVISHHGRTQSHIGRQDVGLRIKPVPDKWTKFTAELDVGANCPESYRRDIILSVSKGEMWLDDFTVVAVNAGKEQKK